MNIPQITKHLARKIILDSQLLINNNNLASGKDGVIQAIEKLGYIQIDPIAVVERAHHHTCWTRVSDYNIEIMDEMQKDHLIFEYWGRANSYLPINDYRFYLPKMRNFRQPKHKFVEVLLGHIGHLIDPVLNYIRTDGPGSTKDFPNNEKFAWGNAYRFTLDFLCWRGDLMIAKRQKFQKVYDLTERVLPDSVNTTFPDENELGKFFVKRALLANGVANEKEIYSYLQPETSRDTHFQAVNRQLIAITISNLVDQGEISPVAIKNLGQKYYAFKKVIENLETKISNTIVHILSPFDNLLYHRNRIKDIFDFDFTVECYVPTSKRKFGLYAMPILWQNNIVGILDPVADRKGQMLVINNLILNEGVNLNEDFLESFGKKLIAFASFNHCKEIKILKTNKESIRKELESTIKENQSL